MVKKAASTSTAKLQTELSELENKYKRVLADYQNQQRRHESSRFELVRFANASLLEKMLAVLDSLELAQAHLQDKGLQLVLDQFAKVLESENVAPILTIKQLFDPTTMDCIEVVDGDKDQVVDTVTKGYLYFDKVLRPARVKVGKGK